MSRNLHVRRSSADSEARFLQTSGSSLLANQAGHFLLHNPLPFPPALLQELASDCLQTVSRSILRNRTEQLLLRKSFPLPLTPLQELASNYLQTPGCKMFP